MESCGELLAKDKLIPLRKLLPATEYPKDMIPFYPQSYSLTRFLVTQKRRATFLAFVGLGMRKDWDSAIRRFYGFDGIDALETAWQQSLVYDRVNPPDVFVRGIVQKIDSNDPTVVQISVGADAGLKEGHTLEVFRLKPQPKYLGLIRIMNVQPSVSIGRRIGTAVRSGALEPGDQVISRFDEKQK